MTKMENVSTMIRQRFEFYRCVCRYIYKLLPVLSDFGPPSTPVTNFADAKIRLEEIDIRTGTHNLTGIPGWL
jgi:hypothetical protein